MTITFLFLHSWYMVSLLSKYSVISRNQTKAHLVCKKKTVWNCLKVFEICLKLTAKILDSALKQLKRKIWRWTHGERKLKGFSFNQLWTITLKQEIAEEELFQKISYSASFYMWVYINKYQQTFNKKHNFNLWLIEMAK